MLEKKSSGLEKIKWNYICRYVRHDQRSRLVSEQASMTKKK